MSAYSVLDARNNLSRLIADARSGAEVVITNRGVPVAQITPISGVDLVGDGRAIVEWIESHVRPLASQRTSGEIESQIEESRGAWE